MQLCPAKKSLESTLKNRMGSTKLLQAMEESKKCATLGKRKAADNIHN